MSQGIYQIISHNQPPLMKRVLQTGLKLSPLAIASVVYCATASEGKDIDDTGLVNFKGFKTREQHLKEVSADPSYDIVVIGGGASGAGVCLDASTRGLRTLVIEKYDFGSGTSSKSTKLIHGGVRYLEQVFALSTDSISSRIQKFKLVTEAIKQRGVMLRNASFMNEKIPFVIPVTNWFSGAYYYVGSIVYYMIYLATREPHTAKFNFPYFLDRSQLATIFPKLSDKYQSGVVYEDGCFNDTRMLITTFLTSTLTRQEYQFLPGSHQPANIVNKAQFIDFIKNQQGQIEGIVFEDRLTGKKHTVKSKYVVNCTGAWADKLRLHDNPKADKRICIVGGSHLTYDSKISSTKFGLCLPSTDGRVLLVVPWLNRVIAGTTQRKFEEPVVNPVISLEERKFIQNQIAGLMDKCQADELIDLEKARWSGLRPLVLAEKAKNTKDIARNHVIERSQSGLYSLMGGKWTTYRKMGEDLVDKISQEQEKKTGKKFSASRSDKVLLVGSCSPIIKAKLMRHYGLLGQYLYKTYGSLALQIVKGDLTPILGQVTKAQLQYLIKNQMVTEVQDVILRRLRIAFVSDKATTASYVPHITRLILEANNQNKKQKEIEELIRQNIEKITSYQFD